MRGSRTAGGRSVRWLALLAICLAAACGSASARPRPSPPPSSDQALGQVLVHLPKKHGPVGVVVLHSFEHGPAELVAQGWSAAADRHGFVAIYPTRGSAWNAGDCCGAAARTGRDDVGWLTGEIHAVAARYALTTIYLAGDSDGGMMVERLVAQAPSVSQRFAVWGSAPEWTQVSSWSGTGYLFHGAHDGAVPLGGGTVRIADQTFHINPSSDTRRNLPRAHLTFATFATLGHSPPPDWPEIAWQALQSGRLPASAEPS